MSGETIPGDIPELRREFASIDDERWRHCHASTVVAVDDELLAAWFAGSAEGADDTGIWMARRTLGVWSRPERVDDGEQVPHWNPVLAVAPGGVLWLFFKRGRRISEWQTLVRTSADGGRSWSPARELVRDDHGGRGPVKNPPLVVGERWFAPASIEDWPSTPGRPGRWDSFIDVSDDRGDSWRRCELPIDHATCRGPGAIQPAVWRNADGGVTALCRSSESRALRSATTKSALGAGDPVFSELTTTGLPNNNSGLGATAFDADGRNIVVCAHNPAAADWGSRSTLVLSASLDDGLTWRRIGRIDGAPDGVGPGADALSATDAAVGTESSEIGRPRAASDRGVDTDGSQEYSYPTVIAHGGMLLVSYTWQRRGVALATVPIPALKEAIGRLG